MFWELSETCDTSFPPDSRVSGVDMKGTAALGCWGTVIDGGCRVKTGRWLGRHTADFPAYLWSHPGAIHSKVEHCPMNKPPAFSSTQENDERFHLKDKTERFRMRMWEFCCFEMVMSGLHFFYCFDSRGLNKKEIPFLNLLIFLLKCSPNHRKPFVTDCFQ